MTNKEKVSAILEMIEGRLGSGAIITYDVLNDYNSHQLGIVADVLDAVIDFDDDNEDDNCCQICNKMCRTEKCGVENFGKYCGSLISTDERPLLYTEKEIQKTFEEVLEMDYKDLAAYDLPNSGWNLLDTLVYAVYGKIQKIHPITDNESSYLCLQIRMVLGFPYDDSFEK
jgi:hypothetical protein